MPRYIVQMRRGGKTQWEESNIIPLAGEIVVEIDDVNHLHKLKIGDGLHTYSELAYLEAGGDVVTQDIITEVLSKTLPRAITVTLSIDKWQKVTDEFNTWLGYYSQVIDINSETYNVTNYSRLDLQPSVDMLAEFQHLDLVFVTENKEGTITVYSIGDMPLKTYTMQATIVETKVEDIVDDRIIGIPVGAPAPKDDMPTIRLVSTKDTDGTMVVSEGNPLTLTVEITRGSLQVGDQIQLCTRKLYTYNQGAQHRYKLRTFKNYEITEENKNETQFRITISTTKEIREMLRGGGDKSANSKHNYYPKYLRIRRGIKADEGETEYTAKFSNVEQFQIFGIYDKQNLCSKGTISIR